MCQRPKHHPYNSTHILYSPLLKELAATLNCASQETNTISGHTRVSIVTDRDFQRTAFSPIRN